MKNGNRLARPHKQSGGKTPKIAKPPAAPGLAPPPEPVMTSVAEPIVAECVVPIATPTNAKLPEPANADQLKAKDQEE